MRELKRMKGESKEVKKCCGKDVRAGIEWKAGGLQGHGGLGVE